MIQLKHISAGYQRNVIVEDVTLDFVPGEVMVLLGPNGCGKSTLLKTALGLLPAQHGEILYDGRPIAEMNRKEIARKAAFLTQSRSTSSIQAFRMVLHGRFPYLSYPRRYGKEDYAIVEQAMKATDSFVHRDKNMKELSGGQRQSVYLAMALAQDTETIFMDEPTTYLDIQRQLQIMKIARELASKGKAVVLVLHDLALALREADKLAVFADGQLKCCDTPEAVYRSGILSQVFQADIHGVETEHGMQYYFIAKEQ